MYDNNMGGLNRSPVHIDLNAIDWSNPYRVKISPNPGCLIVRTTSAILIAAPTKSVFSSSPSGTVSVKQTSLPTAPTT